MVELRIIGGGQTGICFAATHFPCVLGRAADADIRLQDAGVWDRHCRIELDPAAGFQATAIGEAAIAVNGVASPQARHLANGDEIQLGAVRIQFALAQLHQRGLRGREVSTWIGLGLMALVQVLLIYILVAS
jgi:predicted component of type VI protein secretion system